MDTTIYFRSQRRYTYRRFRTSKLGLLAEGVKKATESMIQSLKGKRTFALLEVYEQENDSIAKLVARSQAEGSARKVGIQLKIVLIHNN